MRTLIPAAAAGIALVTTSCSPRAESTPWPEDETMQELTAKVRIVMSCEKPSPGKMNRSLWVNCDSGHAFIETFPDAATQRLEVESIGLIGVGQDYLIGDTWLALDDQPDQMKRMQTYLGGQIRYLGPTPTS